MYVENVPRRCTGLMGIGMSVVMRPVLSMLKMKRRRRRIDMFCDNCKKHMEGDEKFDSIKIGISGSIILVTMLQPSSAEWFLCSDCVIKELEKGIHIHYSTSKVE
jgi:hypothetical protein